MNPGIRDTQLQRDRDRGTREYKHDLFLTHEAFYEPMEPDNNGCAQIVRARFKSKGEYRFRIIPDSTCYDSVDLVDCKLSYLQRCPALGKLINRQAAFVRHLLDKGATSKGSLNSMLIFKDEF